MGSLPIILPQSLTCFAFFFIENLFVTSILRSVTLKSCKFPTLRSRYQTVRKICFLQKDLARILWMQVLVAPLLCLSLISKLFDSYRKQCSMLVLKVFEVGVCFPHFVNAFLCTPRDAFLGAIALETSQVASIIEQF